jgi:hypothetical protein
MEILAAFIVVAAFAILFVILYFKKKRRDAQIDEFFVNSRIFPADYYKAELTALDGQDFICRRMDVIGPDGSETGVHWCEYRVFTHEYTTHSSKIFINFSIIAFPEQLVNDELTEKISRTIDRSEERLRGTLLQRIKKDSERPTAISRLPNGDLATFWTSRKTIADVEYKIRWIKEILG